jgi:DNA-binding transcriptional MerR regulator
MGWSTREVAQLAGTSLRTVRHYHEIGLLDEPERLSNGYKMYRTEHLIRLIEIRRLTGLGFSLGQIAEMDDDPAHLDETLQEVDAELASTIARLEEARRELAELRLAPVQTDMPLGLSAAATEAKLSRADRSLFAVLSQVLGTDTSEHWQGMLEGYERDDADAAFDALPADADEATREALAQRLAPRMQALNDTHGSPSRTLEHAAVGGRIATNALVEALFDLYNPAQLDVFARIWRTAGLI